MHLTIKGRTAKKVKRSLIESAARWYGQHLFHSRIYKKIKLTIHFKRMPMDHLGEAVYDNPKMCKYNYDIFLNRELGERRILTTLAHEMVHTRQYVSYQYISYNRKTMQHLIKYDGIKYDLNKVDYWDCPWEIDATGRELGLYIRFINDMVDIGKI